MYLLNHYRPLRSHPTAQACAAGTPGSHPTAQACAAGTPGSRPAAQACAAGTPGCRGRKIAVEGSLQWYSIS